MRSWRSARPLASLSASRSLASARGLRVSAHTLDHPTPASLEAHLSTLPPSSTLLFTLSTSIPAESLDPLLGVLNSFHSPSPSSSSSRRPGLVGSFHQSAAHIPELAIAAFTPSDGEGITTFYSDASGRAPASVGRWYRTDEPEWPEDERGGEVGELSAVLEGKGWEGVWSARGNEASVELGSGIKSVIALTDGTPQPVLRALAPYGAMTTGLVAAATPFLTGRPFTLFHDGKTYSNGTVGLGLTLPSAASIDYGVEPLDVPAKVATARGNLLLTFEGRQANPTQALIAALQRRDGKGRSGITKDEEFYLSIMEPGSPTPRIVRILSGDPSRGSISLETEQPLFSGQVVQFMYRPAASPVPSPLADALRFAVLPRMDDIAPPAKNGRPSTREGFLAASEGGMIHGEEPAVCTVAGAVMSVHW